MHHNNHILLGVHVTDRVHHVGGVQSVFTKYGCYIKTRIGLHEISDKYCSPNGLIVLEMIGDDDKTAELMEELTAIEGVDVQKLVFEH